MNRTYQHSIDTSKAVEIAPKIWWVGHILENDPFQCHVYLIENGKHSVLLDPGSYLTWPHTRKKILDIIPLTHIKYIVCHHQDPDITLAVTPLLEEIGSEGRKLVTHWRAAELLDHYDWGIEYYEVQANDWQLDANGRKLKFVFTPYMHFPGNFCTYDTLSGTLFSSDIFGAITDRFALYAENAESYFKQMEPFHTHYMPATEIVNHGLDAIERCQPLEMIAPQHGSIITKEMIEPIIGKLRALKCGLYLEFGGTKKVELMTKVNAVLPEVFEAAAYFDSFYADSQRILKSMKKIFPVERIFTLALIDGEYFLRLDSESSKITPCRKSRDEIFDRFHTILEKQLRLFEKSASIRCLEDDGSKTVFLFPLLDYDKSAMGIGMFVFDASLEFDEDIREMLEKFEVAIDVVVKREIEVYRIESEKKRVYSMAMTDNLTKLYNRYYLEEVSTTELAKSKRYNYPIAVIYLDIDHFKIVNDNYGHDVGDIVLKRFASFIKNSLRESDLAFRLGGEEFMVMMPFTTKEQAREIAVRLRKTIQEEGCITIGTEEICYSFSGGITDTEEAGHDLEKLLKIADEKLYSAKTGGRDRIVV